MKKNMSTLDMIVRLLVAMVIIGLYLTKIINGFWAIVFLIISGIFLLTSIFGTCPIYSIFGISTKRK